MDITDLHRDRPRAESFGSVADAYERLRPAFPDALLEDIAALGRNVLDVGTGTGKVARGLLARGASVLGVDADARMAEVARAHGVRVELARFEEWDDAGRRFDVVTCGDAWHWIDPVRGGAVAARALGPGGTLVRFFNIQMLPDDVMDALDVVYREHAPEVLVYGRPPRMDDYDLPLDPFPPGDAFVLLDAKSYVSERRADAAQWSAFVATISDHRRLPPDRLASLQSAIAKALAPFGDIRAHLVTTTLFSRRV